MDGISEYLQLLVVEALQHVLRGASLQDDSVSQPPLIYDGSFLVAESDGDVNFMLGLLEDKAFGRFFMVYRDSHALPLVSPRDCKPTAMPESSPSGGLVVISRAPAPMRENQLGMG